MTKPVDVAEFRELYRNRRTFQIMDRVPELLDTIDDLRKWQAVARAWLTGNPSPADGTSTRSILESIELLELPAEITHLPNS